MTLRISQTLDTVKGSATLRLEGSMSAEEALLLERYCDELAGQSIGAITLDLEGLTFLDDEGGASIRRLRETRGVTLTGCRLFTREVIEGAHNSAVRRKDGDS
jgi:anti-anti-sigma regulatory factor